MENLLEKKWRWWETTPPENTLIAEAAATEYLLLLAEYAREFYGMADRHPPVGFILKDDGGVSVVPDLEEIPREMWVPALMTTCVMGKASYYVLIAEAHVLVTDSADTAKKLASGKQKLQEMPETREGVLLVLRELSNTPVELLFMPKTGEKSLGPVETPGPELYS